MPKQEKQSCGCGFGHMSKSAFGSGANAFFNKELNLTCLKNVYNDKVLSARFGSKKKSRFGPMSISKK
jgi:hypothetical protein